MVDRILIGNHPSFGLGGFVSVPGVDVKTANKFQMMWSSQQEQLQIVSSGSFLVTPAASATVGGTWAPISWTPLGFTPMIFLSCNLYELYLQYTSANSAQVRSVSRNEAMNPTGYPSSNTTGYYMVTGTPKPF